MVSLLFALMLAQAPPHPPAPDQPIPFSHKAHAGDLKLKCKMCHPNAGSGETMQIAKASVCMQCHSAIKTDSPSIQKLAEYAKSGQDIPWVRVYEIPSWVSFSHKTHLDAGNTCEDCHGHVAERQQLFREADMTMGGCVNCHRLKKVSTDCNLCHDPR